MRLRRFRRTDRLRGLVRETRLDLDDFVMPLFVGPESLTNPDLPAMGRFSVGDLVAEADVLAGLGVRAVLLFGIGTFDPIALTAAPVVLGVVAWLAAYLPARRASRMDPLAALRTD